MWWTLAACFHAGLHVRGGEVLGRGEIGLEADGTPLTVAPARVDVGEETISATFGARQMLHPIMALFVPPYSVGGGLRVGLGKGLEGTVNLGLQEGTAGLRVRLADHVALSGAGGVYPTEFPPRWNPGGTLTLDASSGRVRWTGGLRAAQQPYVGFLPARLWARCGSFGEPGCGEYSPGPSIEALRTEVRAIGAVGFAAPIEGDDDEPRSFTIALAPWVTVWHAGTDPGVRGPIVRGVHDFRAVAGGSVWLGLEWGPWGPPDHTARDWERSQGPPSGEGPWTEVTAEGTDQGTWHRGRREGPFVSRDAEGRVRWERSYHRGRLVGPSRSWWPDGTLQEEGSWRHGHQRGPWRGWYEDGSPRYDGVYRASQTGRWTSWDEQGAVTFQQ